MFSLAVRADPNGNDLYLITCGNRVKNLKTIPRRKKKTISRTPNVFKGYLPEKKMLTNASRYVVG